MDLPAGIVVTFEIASSRDGRPCAASPGDDNSPAQFGTSPGGGVPLAARTAAASPRPEGAPLASPAAASPGHHPLRRPPHLRRRQDWRLFPRLRRGGPRRFPRLRRAGTRCPARWTADPPPAPAGERE